MDNNMTVNCESEKLKKLTFLYEALANKKGQDIVAMDLGEQSTFSDIFVLVTGQSDSHMRALVEAADEALSKMGYPVQMEGQTSPQWRLVDTGEIIVHVFSVKGREFYKIDQIWGDSITLHYKYQE